MENILDASAADMQRIGSNNKFTLTNNEHFELDQNNDLNASSDRLSDLVNQLIVQKQSTFEQKIN